MARPGVNYHFPLALKTSNREKHLPRKSGRGKNGSKVNALDSAGFPETQTETDPLPCHRAGSGRGMPMAFSVPLLLPKAIFKTNP